MLEVSNLDVFYGKSQALRDVSLRVNEGEILALVGANGAGKTTLLNTISGLLRPASGSVEFLGRRIDGLPPHSIVELGISHIPEGGRVFVDMTVRENLEMGAYSRRVWKHRLENLEKIYQLFPILRARHGQLARTLSGGEQQMLAVARALARDVKLLLLDEPYEGLAPVIVQEIERILQNIRDLGMTTIIVEQNAVAALKLSDRAVILDTGKVVCDGSAQEVLDNDELREEYLAI